MTTNNYSYKSKGRQESQKTGWSLQRYCLTAICAVLSAATLLSTAVSPAEATAKSPAKTTAPASAADVAYPVNMFDNGKAQHFQYKTNDGVTIKYFVMKSSDGVIRAAFDACVVCWREGKGYVQKDDVMICKNCGRRFPSVKINVITGGCNPAPLTRKIEGDKVVIRAASLQEGKPLFSFGGGR